MKDLIDRIEHNHEPSCDLIPGCPLCELRSLSVDMAATLLDVSVYLITHEGPKKYAQIDHLKQMVTKISTVIRNVKKK